MDLDSTSLLVRCVTSLCAFFGLVLVVGTEGVDLSG